ncbi:uncharacterized protein LOC112213532 [Bombus impatiens]|uniref:Uncharacterized protein LOC112213532 n=1 Tax=Bombus impatiens TaxID=132113 RepID=A0A6P8L4I8_BOMIM|nr:uncharacterized protein LOC112213532 [Bombus impatiens]
MGWDNQRRPYSPSRSVRAPTRNHAHTSRRLAENPNFPFPFFSLYALACDSRVLRVAATRVLHPPILLVVAITLFPFNVTRLHAVLFGSNKAKSTQSQTNYP